MSRNANALKQVTLVTFFATIRQTLITQMSEVSVSL